MGKAFEPPFVVTQRVQVDLSAKELEHALRCWMLEKPVPQAEQFNDVAVRVYADDEGNAISATLIYRPASKDPTA